MRCTTGATLALPPMTIRTIPSDRSPFNGLEVGNAAAEDFQHSALKHKAVRAEEVFHQRGAAARPPPFLWGADRYLRGEAAESDRLDIMVDRRE